MAFRAHTHTHIHAYMHQKVCTCTIKLTHVHPHTTLLFAASFSRIYIHITQNCCLPASFSRTYTALLFAASFSRMCIHLICTTLSFLQLPHHRGCFGGKYAFFARYQDAKCGEMHASKFWDIHGALMSTYFPRDLSTKGGKIVLYITWHKIKHKLGCIRCVFVEFWGVGQNFDSDSWRWLFIRACE